MGASLAKFWGIYSVRWGAILVRLGAILMRSTCDPGAIQYDFTRSWPQGMRFHVGGVVHCNAIL